MSRSADAGPNEDGVLLGCKHAIRVMRRAGRKAGGSIINLASRSGMVGIPGAADYASSKAAVRNHTKSVALYCAEQLLPIRCNSIHPAATVTSMWSLLLGDGPEDVAARACSTRRSSRDRRVSDALSQVMRRHASSGHAASQPPGWSTRMSHTFVSYSHADHELAAEVAQRLRGSGIVVWMDGDALHVGDEWRVQIDDGLARADAVVVLLSAAADASKYVTYEWSYAFASGAALILLRLDRTTEGHPRLSHLQHLDYSDPASRDWERLIADVKRSSNARLAATMADAEAAAALAIEGFTRLLAERYEHMTGAWPGNTRPSAARPDERSVNAFGKSLVQVTSLDVNSAVTELRQLLVQAAAWRREREAANGALMEHLYRQTWENLPGLNQYLAAIAVRGKSMEATWRRAIYAGEDLLRETLPRVAIFETHRLTELRQFIEQHAAWPVLRAELGASLDALTARGSLPIADLVAALAERMRAAVHADLLTVASR